MKRVRIIVIFLSLVGIVFAQEMRERYSQSFMVEEQGILTENIKIEQTPFSKAPSAEWFVYYERPLGTYLYGLDIWQEAEGWRVAPRNPAIVAPARRDLFFEPISSATGTPAYDWSITVGGERYSLSDRVEEKNVLNFRNLASIVSSTVELKGEISGTSATYSYGQYYTDYSDETQKETTARFTHFSYPYVGPITNADYSQGGFWARYGENEYFGPGYVKNGKACTGVMTLFSKPLAPLYVQDIGVWAINHKGKDLLNTIPAGKSLTMEVRYLNDRGEIGDLVATSTATRADITAYPKDTLAYITFKLKVKDSDGLETEQAIILDKADFVVIITGFDNTYDIAFPFSGNTQVLGEGSAYLLFGDEIDYFDDEYGNNILDLYLQLNAAYNCLEFSDTKRTERLQVGVNGGIAVNSQGGQGSRLFSSLSWDDLQIKEISNWLKIAAVDHSAFDINGYYTIKIEAEPLPANLEGRTGYVRIFSEGNTATIAVAQGQTAITAVEEKPVQVIQEGNDLVLSYPVEATSVAVYTINGQKIVEQPLLAGGNDRISTERLAKGVYILKFEGLNTRIKIIH